MTKSFMITDDVFTIASICSILLLCVQDASKGKLTFLTCGRPDLDAAIDKVKANAYIKREEGTKTKVYSCGVGGYQYNQKLQDALDIE